MHFCETWNWGAGSAYAHAVGPGYTTTWNPTMGFFDMNNNELWPVSCNFPNKLVHVGDTDTADQVLAIKIVKLEQGPAFANLTFVSVMLRIVNTLIPAREYYCFEYHRDPTAAVLIGKFVANTFTLLAYTTRAFVEGDIMKGRVTGSLLELLVNDVVELSVSDSSIATAKSLGIQMDQNCLLPFGSVIIDDTFGGDVAEEDACLPVIPPEPEPTPVPPEVRTLVCGAPFAPNPCSQGCPDDPVSSGTHVPFSRQMAFLAPLFVLGLVDGGSNGALDRPTTCGLPFTHAIPEVQTCS
jgi:hypothetical protein